MNYSHSKTRYQDKNISNNSQNYMCPREPSNKTTVASENFNIAETQDKDLKIAFMLMTEVLK